MFYKILLTLYNHLIAHLWSKKMKELNTKEVCEILNEIMEYELGGVLDIHTHL